MSVIRDLLSSQLGRISTPAKETRDMLATLGEWMDGQSDIEARAIASFATGIYFVDVTNGSDENSGLTPALAFKTIKKAINTCKASDAYGANKLDYIFVAPGLYPEGDIIQEGHGTHLIGLGIRGNDSGVRVIPAEAPENAVLGLQAAHCEVANIYFGSEFATPILCSPNHLDNSWIHDCTFAGKYDTTTDCIKILNTRDTVIERNIITGFKNNGIYPYAAEDAYLINTIIRDNLIGPSWEGMSDDAKGIYIEALVLVYNSEINHNHINVVDAGGDPIGIDCDATTRSGNLLITDNYVQVPNGKTPIENAMAINGMSHNHTLAANTVVDPNPAP